MSSRMRPIPTKRCTYEVGQHQFRKYEPKPIEKCVWCGETMPGSCLKEHQLESHPLETLKSWCTERTRLKTYRETVYGKGTAGWMRVGGGFKFASKGLVQDGN